VSAVKEKIIEMIERLPENATVPDITAELYFRQNVDGGSRFTPLNPPKAEFAEVNF